MSSHRRFVSSEMGDEYEQGLRPEHALESYGVVRMGTRSGAYGIETNLREEQQDPSAGGFVDWLFGGFEEEDVAASPTAGGVDPRTGKPVAPEAAQLAADDMNKARDDFWPNVFNFYVPDEGGKKKPDWKKISIVVGVLGGGALLWTKVIQPKLAAGKAAQ
jgi:hypothetical protein